MKLPPVYQFYPAESPVVNYRGLLEVYPCWTQKQGSGPTYGECMRAAWRQSSAQSGIICLEHDIAVSRECWLELADMVVLRPLDVAAVPYLLYPKSTGREFTVWAHRASIVESRYHFISSSSPCPPRPAAFGLGCTYLPGRLLDEMPEDLRQWDYPVLDTRLSDLARELGIACHCTSTSAIHLHY